MWQDCQSDGMQSGHLVRFVESFQVAAPSSLLVDVCSALTLLTAVATYKSAWI